MVKWWISKLRIRKAKIPWPLAMHFQCYALAIFPTIVTRFNNSMEWKFSSKNWTRILGVYYNLDIHDLTIEIDTLVTIACNKAHTCIFQKIIKINFIWALIVYFRLFYFYFYSFNTIYCFVKWGVVSFAELWSELGFRVILGSYNFI